MPCSLGEGSRYYTRVAIFRPKGLSPEIVVTLARIGAKAGDLQSCVLSVPSLTLAGYECWAENPEIECDPASILEPIYLGNSGDAGLEPVWHGKV